VRPSLESEWRPTLDLAGAAASAPRPARNKSFCPFAEAHIRRLTKSTAKMAERLATPARRKQK
jgi:hypothetical protein